MCSRAFRFALLGAAAAAVVGIGITPERPLRAQDDPPRTSSTGAASAAARPQQARDAARNKALKARRETLRAAAKSADVDGKAAAVLHGVAPRRAFSRQRFEADAPAFEQKLSEIADGEPFVVINGPEQYESTDATHEALFVQAEAAGLQVLKKLKDHELRRLMDRCLMIVDREVVEDPTRTTGLGAWTFGHLMTQMAHQSATGIDPAAFTRRWLAHWESAQSVNGFTVPARPAIQARIIAPWQALSGGAGKPLDLSKAPFRLLAIVNRVDLRSNLVMGESRIGDGGGGEARFVFCAVDLNDKDENGAPKPLPFTVIFEYQIKRANFEAVQDWAKEWYALREHAPGSLAYNFMLQKITDQFVTAGADPEAPPNRSALGQLRTNEIALASPWELREFRLDVQNAGYLRQVTVKQTPDDNGQPVKGFNNKPVFKQFVNAHEGTILERDHRVPVEFPSGSAFLGASAPTPTPPDYFWKASGINKPQARHLTSLITCNGCHAREAFPPFVLPAGIDPLTDPARIPNHFTHVRPRKAGAASTISSFLSGIDPTPPLPPPGSPPKDFCLKDPAGQKRDGNLLECQTPNPPNDKHRRFRDLVNRAYDLNSLVNDGSPAEALRRQYLNRVH